MPERDPMLPVMTGPRHRQADYGARNCRSADGNEGAGKRRGLVVVQGDIFKLETKELKGGELLLVTFAITDYTSSILCKAFMRYRRPALPQEEG